MEKTSPKKIIKIIVIAVLLFIVLFTLIKCTRITVITFVDPVTYVKDTDLLFNIGDFTSFKNTAYQQYTSLCDKDDEPEFISFSPMDHSVYAKMKSEKKISYTIEDYSYDKAKKISDILRGGQKVSGDSGFYIRAYKNTVIFDPAYYENYFLIYTTNMFYPSKELFYEVTGCKYDIEFVRISPHWFHGFVKTNDFWGGKN